MLLKSSKTALLLWLLLALPGAAAAAEALLVPLQGAIGPAAAEIVADGIAEAEASGAAVVVLRLDTPGGLDRAMRRIIQSILNANVPVVAYVAPSGARAASAGTYILYAAQVAAMAPATNLGAATPVQVGGGLPGLGGATQPDGEAGDKGDAEAPAATLRHKQVNDAVAYIRGLAELRGRNAAWAERAVREAVSLSAAAALEQQVIDLVADDPRQLLQRIDGLRVTVAGGERTLQTAGLTLRQWEPDWRIRLLSVLGNPNIAYILLMIGIYGLIFELANPGSLVPGVIGALCLLLAFYALQLLPVNYAGLALMLLGIALMTGEAFAPSFGILGFGGLVALVAGSVILLDEDGLRISLPLIGTTALLGGALSFWVLGRLLQTRHRTSVIGPAQLVGRGAVALDDFDADGRVRVAGEVWRAHSSGTVRRGQSLRITAVRGLVLDVTPDEEE